ncbi:MULTISPECIES: hypothetical protein [unclassified Mesorhizobium]|uniref:hypothetical protein n=1 Tax=unclassified Mesorhizobium TaxID=325217 RepID=UPI0015E434B4|nr:MULTISPECIES: hypothetical protein [unclassified Mesorhizobium]
MKKLAMLLAAGIALTSCDGSTPPTKAPGDAINQTPQNPTQQITTGGDQPGKAPRQ